MKKPHPSTLRSARDEPAMSRLPVRERRQHRRFLSFISQLRLENIGNQGGIRPNPPPATGGHRDVGQTDEVGELAIWRARVACRAYDGHRSDGGRVRARWRRGRGRDQGPATLEESQGLLVAEGLES